MCGDYYIGGRQFESLSDLIGYYTACSCLFKNEQLKHPVPPAEVRCSLNTLVSSSFCALKNSSHGKYSSEL